MIPILLLLVISINHLNIIDAIVHYSTRCHTENNKAEKNFPAGEETEKGNQAKDKSEEQEKEKYYAGHTYPLSSKYQLSANDKFMCYSTALNKHPYRDDDIQPPKAV